MEERVRSCEESARRRALDEFMGDIRVEERQFLQEGKSLSGRKSLVVQERVCFRNIPLTGWIEHEFPAGAAVSHSAPPPGRPEPVLAEVEPIPRRLLG
jgi:hypothetical protein